MTHRVEQIGPCTLYLGDCLEILPTLTGVDAVVTDPPYGIGFAAQPTRYQRINGMRPSNWDNVAPHKAVETIVSLGLPTVIWGGNYFRLPPSRGWIVWGKRGNAPSMADLEMAWTSTDQNSRLFEKTVSSASREKNLQANPHPTQKAIALMQFSIEYIKAGETILDPFMGSGTTGVACIKTGRKFIGIEIDPTYYEISLNRIRKAWQEKRSELPLEAAT